MKPRLVPARDIYRDFIVDLHDWAGWQAVHVDYDGPGDNRAFTGRTRAEIVEQIDEWHDEQTPEHGRAAIVAASLFWIAVLAGFVWFAVYVVRNGGLQ